MVRRRVETHRPAMAPLLDVEDVISKLNIEEKVDLLTGRDFWHTNAVHRLGVPSIRLSDGPNGVRGTQFLFGVPAACLPCGTGLAATWDKKLIESGGKLMGEEARAKGAHVLLGPTANIQRSPLGGRGFESFSEDPYLSGTMGAATVNGIQSTGVAATAKHFVCNDQEHERNAYSAEVTERALREIYLMPFMIMQKHARPLAYMTAYNKINGTSASENPKILRDILRNEWGFNGLVMSDWFGTYSSAPSLLAGLDLEMPGPSHVRGAQTHLDLKTRHLTESTIDDRIRAVLSLVNHGIKSGIPENAPEKTVDTPETAAKLRELGAASQVLLKNDGAVLPLDKKKTVAVIGPNAKIAAYSGGGSASLPPYYTITPFQGISAQASSVEYALGATAYKNLPLLSEICKSPGLDSQPGLTGRIYNEPPTAKDRTLIDEVHFKSSNCFLIDYNHAGLNEIFYIDLEATVTPDVDGDYEFGLSVAGTGKLFLDDKLVIDNATKQRVGESFFGSGTVEEKVTVSLNAGKTYTVRLEFGSGPTTVLKVTGATAMGNGGFRMGMTKVTDPEEEIQKAVQLAKEVEQVVVIAGLSAEWESEGYDRSSMALPGHTDALIARVAAANPRTVVVLQSGTPVSLPWLDAVPAVLHSWFGGNELGNAIADVLFGSVNPAGKLPLSWPKRVEDNPAFLNFRSELGRTLYGEDVFVGYRYYEKTRREVLFPFGHGLSYSRFDLSGLSVSDSTAESASAEASANATLTLKLTVKNTGKFSGAAVIQAYVAPGFATKVTRPVKELKGFEKVYVEAGKSKEVEITMEKRAAVSWWDESRDAWCVEEGRYEVVVGQSSSDQGALKGEFGVGRGSWWRGL